MCGIVGLLLKEPTLRDKLGELMAPMLIGMTSRGPDSAGVALFSEPVDDGVSKISLFWGEGVADWKSLARDFSAAFSGKSQFTETGRHAVLQTATAPEDVRRWFAAAAPQVYLLSVGSSIDLYKDIGAPAQIVARYGLDKAVGTHVVAHTRMATESAVTPAHAHPFTAGRDFCLVHNGSLSNPHLVRKKLEPLGITFVTDNDTEAACRFFEWRMREGDDLTTAVQRGFSELDGFFTFLMGTDKEMLIVRDAFACKPAVVAETDDYVAIASEFRSLAHLPGVRHAHVFEPKPEEVYSWKV
ncbi:MAG: class II glutamine amidotransferase [Pseudomonadota bacterium]